MIRHPAMPGLPAVLEVPAQAARRGLKIWPSLGKRSRSDGDAGVTPPPACVNGTAGRRARMAIGPLAWARARRTRHRTRRSFERDPRDEDRDRLDGGDRGARGPLLGRPDGALARALLH